MTEDYRSKYEVIEEISGEILQLMEDLYQSGFDTVHDSTLRDLGKAAELTEQYGMQYLSELLGGLVDEISAGRHQTKELHSMKEKKAAVAKLYTSLNEYLALSRQKAAYDRGLNYYTQTEELDMDMYDTETEELDMDME